jgi:transcriptional regulator with XRE-family HTH domain
MKETHIGDELAHLRKGRISQADLAKAMGFDQSRVSRIEADPKPDSEDIKKYLAALNGDPAAKELRKYLESDWPNLKPLGKPAYRHPYLQELAMAETALGKLQTFISDQSSPPDLVQQAKQYESSLREVAAFLSDLKHNLAFVGKIAVGKTTALCFITDLLINDAKTLKQKVALDTGAGWTTQSEVRVGTLDSGMDETSKFGIVVYPHPQEEVSRLVTDICYSLLAIRDGRESDSRVPEEVEKVLRSMAELPRRSSKENEGELYDPLLELAKAFNTPDRLTAEFQSRMNLNERTETGFWFDAPNEQVGLAWLRDEFRKVNNGRHPKVSLAKRIDVFVPRALVPDCIYELTCVDTKGTDETAIRPDLQVYFDDPRTITVLCSHFAPDSNMIDVLGHLAATGKAVAILERVVFLVLPREEEALSMNSEDGTTFESVKEAYALREAQIRSKLSKHPGGRDVPIISYDSVKEKPDKVRKKLLEKLDGIRAVQSTRLKELVCVTEDLVTKFQQEQAKIAFGKLRKKLQEFVDAYHQLPAQAIKAQSRLLAAFKYRHHRTVWASTRRDGEWDNLNSYLIVGVAANEDAEARSKAALAALDTLFGDLSKDPECAVIQSHLTVLKDKVAQSKLNFLKKVANRSQEIYRASLFKDKLFWTTCEGHWRGGRGFQDRVVGEVNEWLALTDHEWIHQAIDAIIRADWQDMFIAPIQEQAKEPEPPAPDSTAN